MWMPSFTRYGRDTIQVRQKTFTFLYDKFTQDNKCQFLSDLVRFCRLYTKKNIFGCFFRFTVYISLSWNRTRHIRIFVTACQLKSHADDAVPWPEVTILSLFTCAGKSISGVPWQTITRVAALSVIAAALSTTTSVVCCTLVDICIFTNQRTQ